MPSGHVNGWSPEDIDILVRRTARPRELVEAFCRAVDKRLFLTLSERQRRSTLHFHLDLGDGEGGDPEGSR